MKRLVFLFFLFLVLVLPLSEACQQFLNGEESFWVFLETKNNSSDFDEHIFYNNTLYTDFYESEKYNVNISRLDMVFIGNNYVRVELTRALKNREEETDGAYYVKLHDVLSSLQVHDVITISDEDIVQIIATAQTNNVVLKVPYFKIGSFESSKKQWISYYTDICYSTEDIQVPSLVLFGKRVTSFSWIFWLVLSVLIVFLLVKFYKKK